MIDFYVTENGYAAVKKVIFNKYLEIWKCLFACILNDCN